MKKVPYWLMLTVMLLLIVGCTGEKPPLPVTDPVVDPPPLVEPEPEEPPTLPGMLIASVENHPSARPQSGLEHADIVFEMDCEAGITRFLAIFATRPAEEIGPIRSVRTYFAQIVKAYNAPFAHAGGSTDGLAMVQQLKLKDLDEIYNAGSAFWRSKDRKMPHNLYTSTDRLIQGATKKGYSLPAYTPLAVGQVTGGEDALEVNLVYANNKSYKYSTGYGYDGESYRKSANGKPFMAAAGTQITTKNLIVLVAKTKWLGEKNPPTTDIQIVGEGAAFFFTGGRLYQGIWRKDSAAAHFQFLYQGAAMQFAPGNTWINVIPGVDRMQYSVAKPE